MFNKEVLKSYLLTIKMNNDEFAFLQGPVNTDRQVRASKMATFTGTDNPYMVIRDNCTAKEYKSYKRRMLENKEIEKFLDEAKLPAELKRNVNDEFFEKADKEFQRFQHFRLQHYMWYPIPFRHLESYN